MNGKKKNIILFLLFGGVFVCFCACTSGTKAKGDEPATPYVWLTNSSRYILLPTENIKYPLDSHQLVSASYQGKDYFLNTYVKANMAGLNMTIINELGVNMGELSYRNGSVSFSSPVFSLPFKPEYIIADFQFCFYNFWPLEQSLKNCGLVFEEIGPLSYEDPSWAVRKILLEDHKTVIIRIEKKSRNVIEIVNHLRGYSYTLEGNFE